jgi:hypothetical protein
MMDTLDHWRLRGSDPRALPFARKVGQLAPTFNPRLLLVIDQVSQRHTAVPPALFMSDSARDITRAEPVGFEPKFGASI